MTNYGETALWRLHTASTRCYGSRTVRIAALVMVLPFLLAGIGLAGAAVFEVVNTNDDGPGSLREALENANASTGPHTVIFASSLAGQTILLTTSTYVTPLLEPTGSASALIIEQSMTINGSAAPGLTIARAAAAPEMRLLLVYSGSVTLRSLTLRDGIARGENGEDGAGGRGGGGAGMGGAIFNDGATLSIVECTLADNQAIGGDTGADSSGSGTTEGTDGGGPYHGEGGVYPAGDGSTGGPYSGGGGGANCVSCEGGAGGNGGLGGGGGGGGGNSGGTFNPGPGGSGGLGGEDGSNGTGNKGGDGGAGAGLGGAIFNSGGIMFISRSLITGNRAAKGGDGNAGAFGGGLFIDLYGGVHIDSSTICSNEALGYDGGGAGIYSDGGDVSLESVTIFGHGQSALRGSNFSLRNSILSGYCWETSLGSIGHNLEHPGDTCGLDGANDMVNLPIELLGLATLANNGGPTWTSALLEGSVAIDTGTTGASCPATDQRGEPRPADGNLNGIASCDRGAYELHKQVFADGFEAGDTSAWSATAR